MSTESVPSLLKGISSGKYYECRELAQSYYEFGVPYELAKEWLSSKLNVSKEVAKSICFQFYL